jgi:dolichol kinase
VIIIFGSVLYKTILDSLIIGILTCGDGLAAVIGVPYRSQRKIYRTKSLDGFHCVSHFNSAKIALTAVYDY